MRNNSNENEFDLHENELVGETHFHMNGFALRLVLTQRQRELGYGLFKYSVRVKHDISDVTNIFTCNNMENTPGCDFV